MVSDVDRRTGVIQSPYAIFPRRGEMNEAFIDFHLDLLNLCNELLDQSALLIGLFLSGLSCLFLRRGGDIVGHLLHGSRNVISELVHDPLLVVSGF